MLVVSVDMIGGCENVVQTPGNRVPCSVSVSCVTCRACEAVGATCAFPFFHFSIFSIFPFFHFSILSFFTFFIVFAFFRFFHFSHFFIFPMFFHFSFFLFSIFQLFRLFVFLLPFFHLFLKHVFHGCPLPCFESQPWHRAAVSQPLDQASGWSCRVEFVMKTKIA